MSDTEYETELIPDLVAKARISALYAGLDELKKTLNSVVDEVRFPWRFYPEPEVDEKAAIKQAMREIEDEIIHLERHYVRDPEQDAEMRMEIEASIALNGNHSDRAEWYLHTALEEERFQERIHDQIEYGYNDPEDGWVDGISERPNVGNCNICHNYIDFEDCVCVNGEFTCDMCYEDIRSWFEFLTRITNTYVVKDRWDSEVHWQCDAFVGRDGKWYLIEYPQEDNPNDRVIALEDDE